MVSLVFAVFLIQFAYKRRGTPGAVYFILLLLSTAIYNGGYIGEINSNTQNWALFWFDLEHIGIPFQQYLWVMMSLSFLRVTEKHIRIAKYAFLLYPVLFLLVYFTNGYHHLYISNISFESNGYFPVLVTEKGPAYILAVAGGTGMAAYCLVLYIRGYIRASRAHRNGYLIMMTATLFPWITVYLNVTSAAYLGIDYFPVLSFISGVFFMVGIFQYKVFQIIPIATEMVFRHSKEGILLIDLADRIVDGNEALFRVYPDAKGLISKSTLKTFLELHPELYPLADSENELHYRLALPQDRHYSAKITDIVAEDGILIGKMLTVSDITLFIEIQKQLEFMASRALDRAETNELSFLQAQIKPHFLNNTLSVISSLITRDPQKAKELIADLGEYLVRSCYFDENADLNTLTDELETVNIYVAIESARFGGRLSYELVCENIPDVNIPRLVLQPLVENAIRHGILKKAEGGRVCLKIEQKGDEIDFCISDDGVGMPEEGIAALISYQNRRGVGLRNIQKRLEKNYGRGLAITSAPGQGTTVSFTIPRLAHEKIVRGGALHD